MREAIGDLWTYPADVRVITTNGDIDRNGELVMGKGTALQAKTRYPGIARELAQLVEKNGNQPQHFTTPEGEKIWTFPVKYHWKEIADLPLIQHSAKKLVQLANLLQEVRAIQMRPTDLVIAMPRPGCGNGRRTWEEVKPLLDGLLDDRFVVLTTQRDLDV